MPIYFAQIGLNDGRDGLAGIVRSAEIEVADADSAAEQARQIAHGQRLTTADTLILIIEPSAITLKGLYIDWIENDPNALNRIDIQDSVLA